jgi:hypothetical protein
MTISIPLQLLFNLPIWSLTLICILLSFMVYCPLKTLIINCELEGKIFLSLVFVPTCSDRFFTSRLFAGISNLRLFLIESCHCLQDESVDQIMYFYISFVVLENQIQLYRFWLPISPSKLMLKSSWIVSKFEACTHALAGPHRVQCILMWRGVYS